MQDPNRKDSEPKIALSPPALFALAAVIFFLAGGIFAYVQLIGRGLQKTTASSSPFVSRDQASPFVTPSSTPVQSPALTPPATPIPTATVAPTSTPSPTAAPTPETLTPTPEPAATETPAETLQRHQLPRALKLQMPRLRLQPALKLFPPLSMTLPKRLRSAKKF